MRFLCSLLRPDDVVVEVGANVGALTVPLARAVSDGGAVWAFEPQASLFDLLVANAQENGVRDAVHPMPMALGAVDGEAWYSENEWNCGGVPVGANGENQAHVARLDAAVLKRVDLIKVDVEGMEADVLLGARNTIACCRPLLYVEETPGDAGRRTLDMLFAAGYRVWRHHPQLFRPDNFRGVGQDPFDGVASLNLFAVPVEREPSDETIGRCAGEVFPGEGRDAPRSRWACMARMGGIGDNLIASSVLPGLKARYGHVEVVTREPAHVVFENNPYIDKLTVLPKDEPVPDMAAWNRNFQVQLSRYDFGIHLSGSCEGTLALFESQFQFGWPKAMREKLCGESYLGFVHDVCGLPHRFAPGFFPTALERLRAAEVMAEIRKARDAPCIGWALAGSRLDKTYPGSHLAIGRLLEAGLNVLMFGAPGREYLMAKEIEQQVVHVTGADARGSAAGLYLCMSNSQETPNWPIRRSLAQIRQCDLVAGPDTGAMWSVAMLPMPKVVLLSHASPRNIVHGWVNATALHADRKRVDCSPCHRLQDRWETCRKANDVEAAACMADIPVGLVVQVILHVLGGGDMDRFAEDSRVARP